MDKIKQIYVSTCDKTSYILTPFEYLVDKYLPEIKIVNIMGYSVFPDLSQRFRKISLKPTQDNISNWCLDIYDFIVKSEDELVFFGLDDFLPIQSINYEIFNTVIEYMESDPKIGRYELGFGHNWHGNTKKTTHSFNDWSIYEYGELSEYRISTQFSIWRKEYLLKYLNNKWSPWEFELIGSKMAKSDGFKIIATSKNVAFNWVQSAVSAKYPGMINIEGIDSGVLNEMISVGILNPKVLQVGHRLNSKKYNA